jgi:hypothetical protein
VSSHVTIEETYRIFSEKLARRCVCQTRLINQKMSPEGTTVSEQSVRHLLSENHNETSSARAEVGVSYVDQ